MPHQAGAPAPDHGPRRSIRAGTPLHHSLTNKQVHMTATTNYTASPPTSETSETSSVAPATNSRPARTSRSRIGRGNRDSAHGPETASTPGSRARPRPQAEVPGGNAHDQTTDHQPRPPRYATELALPDGRIEVISRRSRRRVLIEPGSSQSPRGPLLQVSGHPFAMNGTLNARFGGCWDPVTRTWMVPVSKGIALRAYLAEHL